MSTINEELKKLRIEVEKLKSKVKDLSKNVESVYIRPYSKVGSRKMQGKSRPIDIVTGLGQEYGGYMMWNDSDLNRPPYNQKPAAPNKGYSKHGHSRYSGGALDISTIEIVDYNVDFDTSYVYNKHCQGFWRTAPSIKRDEDGNEKIGHLLLQWDKDTIDPITGQKGVWKAGGITVIDVKKTLFVEYDDDGNILHSAPLIGADDNSTNMVWDDNANCWRFYAVFKPYVEN